ncbi:prevent-host-death protein [Paenibacillus sp. FSL W8-1187]|uniref:prevent-host-death protein n=1 Tax=Paenibacillus sp. FSL W8-1187 TaxID=2975339 RepID=UPI0030DB31C8
MMPIIKPISDLSNYKELLRDLAEDEPVFLTMDGHGRYVLLDIKEYEKLKASLQLMTELAEGERSGKTDGWMSLQDVEREFGL